MEVQYAEGLRYLDILIQRGGKGFIAREFWGSKSAYG